MPKALAVRSVLSALGRLRPGNCRACWSDALAAAPDEAKQQPGMGVTAQDVERVFPELVETTPEGLNKVEYTGLIAPIIEAIKELDDRLRTLEERSGPPPAQG